MEIHANTKKSNIRRFVMVMASPNTSCSASVVRFQYWYRTAPLRRLLSASPMAGQTDTALLVLSARCTLPAARQPGSLLQYIPRPQDCAVADQADQAPAGRRWVKNSPARENLLGCSYPLFFQSAGLAGPQTSGQSQGVTGWRRASSANSPAGVTVGSPAWLPTGRPPAAHRIGCLSSTTPDPCCRV